jgi:hypothetical protein
MPRHPASRELSITQLEKLLRNRRSKVNTLERKRAKVLRQLESVEAQIAALGGSSGAGRGRGTRPRNKMSLAESILGILKKDGGPMKVGDIVKGVLNTGYMTTSDNFRGIVNQALIKDKRFVKGDVRGSYQLKK